MDVDLQKIRDISIAEQLGLPKGRRVTTNCPFPNHSDNTPSFLIDENNGFHCFGCGEHGQGFIDFCTIILMQNGMDKKEAFKEIIKQYE